MSNSHDPAIPIDLSAFVHRLDDLKGVFGPAVEPVLAAVKDSILQAMAARDRGDSAAAWQSIRDSMERLAAFADRLDPVEATAMRAVAQMFGTALTRGDTSEAKRTAAVMFEKSGARERKSN